MGTDQRCRYRCSSRDEDDNASGDSRPIPQEHPNGLHQTPPGSYPTLVRGSSIRFVISTTRFTRTKDNAMNKTTPCTTWMSLAMTELTNCRPSPGQPNTSSVKTAPPSKYPTGKPQIVTIGG